MKTKINKPAMILMALALAFALVFTGCENPSLNDDNNSSNGSDDNGTGGKDTEPKLPLTEGLGFGMTIDNDSEISLAAQPAQGVGEAEETRYFSVMEKDTASFTVTKTATQTVTLGGPDSTKVSKQTGTFEGSTPSDTLEIYTLDFNHIEKYFGETRIFTLTVSEQGKASKNITINLTVEPDINEGCTIFTVNGETLAKVDAKIGNTPVDNLMDAFKWIDMQTASGTANNWKEYLVRLEKDEPEKIVKMAITCKNADYVKIRLRGAGKERKIIHDGSTTEYNNNGNANSDTIGYGLLAVGQSTNGGYVTVKSVALQIEKNVTLDGKGGFITGRNFNLDGMVVVWDKCQFIMEKGSKITNMVARGAMSTSTATEAVVGLNDNSKFIMNGGEISGNKVADQYGPIVCYLGWSTAPDIILFSETGGIFKNNTYKDGGTKSVSNFVWDNPSVYMSFNMEKVDPADRPIEITSKAKFDYYYGKYKY